MKQVWKKWAQRPLVQAAASCLLAGYMYLLHYTIRWTRHGDDALHELLSQGKPVILCFWHSHLLLAPLFWKPFLGTPFYMLISRHRDGRMVAGSARYHGVSFITGSARNEHKHDSNKGGIAATRAMLRALKGGACIGITPDGPRGPVEKVQPGILAIAAASGAPIVPAAIGTTFTRTLNTWDRFRLHFPFGRGVICLGAPLFVHKGFDEAVMATTLEQALQDCVRIANGKTPVHQPTEH